MAKIPTKKSTHGGIPVTDVKSAQAALLSTLQTPYSEQPEEEEVQTEVMDQTSEQAMENAESVETKAEDSVELTADDLVGDDEQEEIPELKTFTVKVGNKEVQVTQDELLAGYSRQADYTKKSRVLAEQRREAESTLDENKKILDSSKKELAATQQERQQYSQRLEQLSKLTGDELEQLQKQDWDKLKVTTNQTEYLRQKDKLRDLQDQAKLIQEEQDKVLQEQGKDFQEKWKKTLEENKKLIVSKIPEYFDPVKGERIQDDIRKYGIKEGLTEQELDVMVDARAVYILYKSMKYDQLVNAKISTKKAKVVPKMQKSGVPATRSEVSADRVKQLRARAKRSGKVDDAAALLKSLLPES